MKHGTARKERQGKSNSDISLGVHVVGRASTYEKGSNAWNMHYLAHNHTGYISQNCLVHPTLKMPPHRTKSYMQANMRAVADHSSDPRAEFFFFLLLPTPQ